MEEQNLTTKKKKKWLLPTIIAVIVIIAALVITLIYNLPANRRDRQLALAEKYMSELNYEAAILAYKAAIEIDPKCEDAYLELLDLYIAMEAYDMAEEVIAQAENNLDDKIVLSMREKANTLSATADTKSDNMIENTNQEENENTTEATTESEPYLRYMQATKYDSEDNITSIIKEEYDTNGNIINYIEYDESNNISCHNEYSYNENNIKIKFISYYSNGTIKEQYEYDANGNVIESMIYNEKGDIISQKTSEYEEDGSIHILELGKNNRTNTLYVECEYFYDSNWNILKEITYDESEEALYQTEFLYDGQKLMVETDTDIDSNYISKAVYEYFDDGKIKSITMYSSYDGEPFIQEKIALYSYDEFGNRIESFYNYNTLLRIQIFDKNNNEIKAEYYTDGELYYSQESQYDEHGNIVYYTDYDTTSFYEYDNNGNITHRKKYINHNGKTYLEEEHIYEYNELGKEVKYISYYYNIISNELSDLTNSIEYQYDFNGNLIEETQYYRDNTIRYRTEYEYIYE